MIPFWPDHILTRMKSITKIGIGKCIWEVERIGSVVDLVQWSMSKMKFMSAEDFGCVDEFWVVELEHLGPWDI
jgi:hypothetical protein